MRRKKHVKKGIQFTMMVCGASGTGRTSFVNTLCGQQVLTHEASAKHKTTDSSNPSSESSSAINESAYGTVEISVFDPAKANVEPGINIIPVSVDMNEEDGTRISLTVIDTPGFGDNLDNETCFAKIVSYLECQFDEILAEESRIRRNPRFKDNRVHVLLYFIEPTGHGLRELDVELMKNLSNRVNIIPVIGRADSMTPAELATTKKLIMEDIEHFNIPVYNFPYDVEEDDSETIEENSRLKAMLPFAIVTSSHFIQVDGRKIRARQYPWGVVDIENPQHSDYSVLRSAILGSHLIDLRDLTHDFLYESYRTEKLSKGISDPHETTLLNPEDLANQSFILKEEQLQREEEKLRHIESRVQREINEKRLELLNREQELREIEARIERERSATAVAEEHEALQRQIEKQNIELQKKQSLQNALKAAATPAQAAQIAINNNIDPADSSLAKLASSSTMAPAQVSTHVQVPTPVPVLAPVQAEVPVQGSGQVPAQTPSQIPVQTPFKIPAPVSKSQAQVSGSQQDEIDQLANVAGASNSITLPFDQIHISPTAPIQIHKKPKD